MKNLEKFLKDMVESCLEGEQTMKEVMLKYADEDDLNEDEMKELRKEVSDMASTAKDEVLVAYHEFTKMKERLEELEFRMEGLEK